MLIIGEEAFFTKTITEYDVYSFAGITGDFNSVHVNDVYAKQSMFGKRIAHGMLIGSFISTVLGQRLPGPGTIYLEQNLKFLKPVYIGDTVTAKVKVKEILKEEKGIYSLETRVINQDDIIVADGYAIAKYNG